MLGVLFEIFKVTTDGEFAVQHGDVIAFPNEPDSVILLGEDKTVAVILDTADTVAESAAVAVVAEKARV